MDKKILAIGICGLVIIAAASIFVFGGAVDLAVNGPPLSEECEEKGDYRHGCYVTLAIDTENSNYCYNLDEPGAISACVATATHNTGPCDAIGSEFTRERCKDPVHYYWGITNNDVNECNKILESSLKDRCKKDIGAVINPNDCGGDSSCYKAYGKRHPNGCENVENKHDRDDCYESAAKSTEDTSYCLKLSDEDDIEECIGASTSEENPEKCANYENVSDRDWCYMWMAEEYEKEEYCAAITYWEDKYECYDWVLFVDYYPITAEDCAKQIKQHEKDECYDEVAWQIEDYALCQKISDPSIRNRCMG